MKDVSHRVSFGSDDGRIYCADCKITLPEEMRNLIFGGDLGTVVVQIGMAFVPGNLRDPGHIPCTNPGAKAAVEAITKLQEGEIVLGEPPQEKNTVKFPKKSEFEKRATRGQFNSFIAMKEATRPEETK